MKKLKKSGELMWLFGTIFVALGVSLCSKADLGVSMIAAPAFIINDFAIKFFPTMTVGVMEYIFQGFLLVIMCIVIRKFNIKYLLAFAVAVIYGWTLNLFLWLLKDITVDEVYLRWLLLFFGDTVTALGVSCYFKTYLPLQVYELFVAECSTRFNKNINKVKGVFDFTLLFSSIVLVFLLFKDFNIVKFTDIFSKSYHSIGLGTLFTTLINSPIIALWSKLLNKLFGNEAKLPKLEKALKR